MCSRDRNWSNREDRYPRDSPRVGLGTGIYIRNTITKGLGLKMNTREELEVLINRLRVNCNYLPVDFRQRLNFTYFFLRNKDRGFLGGSQKEVEPFTVQIDGATRGVGSVL